MLSMLQDKLVNIVCMHVHNCPVLRHFICLVLFPYGLSSLLDLFNKLTHLLISEIRYILIGKLGTVRKSVYVVIWLYTP